MNILTYMGSPRTHANTAKLLNSFEDLCKSNNHTIKRTVVEKPCIHCGICTDGCGCCMNDPFSKISLDDYQAIVIASPIYFFALTPKTLNFLSRLYSTNLSGKIIVPIIVSGSDFEQSGIHIIREQFRCIDEYCGTFTIPPMHKVTYDEIWEVTDRDLKGLENTLKSLEGAYYETQKQA